MERYLFHSHANVHFCATLCIYKNVYIAFLQDFADGDFVDDFFNLVLMSSDKKCKCRYNSVKAVISRGFLYT